MRMRAFCFRRSSKFSSIPYPNCSNLSLRPIGKGNYGAVGVHLDDRDSAIRVRDCLKHWGVVCRYWLRIERLELTSISLIEKINEVSKVYDQSRLEQTINYIQHP